MTIKSDIYFEYILNGDMQRVYQRHLNVCLEHNQINYIFCELKLLITSFALLFTEKL